MSCIFFFNFGNNNNIGFRVFMKIVFIHSVTELHQTVNVTFQKKDNDGNVHGIDIFNLQAIFWSLFSLLS